MRLTRLLAVLVAALLCSCGASGGTDETARPSGSDASSTSAAPGPAASNGDFGDLRGVCGPGNGSVDPSQRGLDNGKLNIGVATDRGAQIRPGLNREVWDASVALAKWCNDHGGIHGLMINPIELDGALFNVEAAMSTACTDAFAMVGGGFAQDNLEFSKKAGSDFHQCGLIAIPAFAVSPEKAGSNGQVQPLPNPPDNASYGWIQDYARLYPEDAEAVTIVYGELPSLVEAKDHYVALAKAAGIEVADTVAFPPAGPTDWTPYALKVISSGARTVMIVGEASSAAGLLAKLHEQGFTGRALLDVNMYDPMLFSQGDAGPEGAVVRIGIQPFEEAARHPATSQYLDLLRASDPEAAKGSLGVASMSAWLLFATAANRCAEANKGVIDRACILEQAAAVDDWTGAGLHLRSDPAGRGKMVSGQCTLLLEVHNGTFRRRFPAIGSSDDNDQGSHCRTGTVIQLPGGGSRGVVGQDQPL